MTDVEYTVGTEGSRVFVTSRGDYRQGDGTAGWRSVSAAASPRGRPPGQCQAGGASQRLAGGPGVASAATSRDDADSGAISDSAILNFALNLEYLEANFYSFAVHGHAILGSLMSGTGNQGGISGGAQVPFKSKGIRQLAREIAGDELAHVTALRSALGSAAVSQPALELKKSFTAAAQAAGVVPAGTTFDPFANENFFCWAPTQSRGRSLATPASRTSGLPTGRVCEGS